ncbi:MAG: cytochrome c oxidase assembly protein [Acidobacteriota bacterium]
MQDATRAIFEEWSPPLFLTVSSIVVALVYARGWWLIRKTRPLQFPAWRLLCFETGIAVLWLAIGSPMDGFADALLSAHMVEHLLLMSFVPPLVLLGWPVVPMLRGLPRWFTRPVLGPLIRLRFLRRLGHWLTTPLVAWLLMNLVFLSWHVPRAYDFALENETWHDIEHMCFLFTSILFWWPLIRPWPMKDDGLGWFMLPYLALADIVNTMLSAFLAFCDRPVYAYYVQNPNGFGISPLMDQKAGAAVMWVVGSLVFLVPAVLITLRLVQRRDPPQVTQVHGVVS